MALFGNLLLSWVSRLISILCHWTPEKPFEKADTEQIKKNFWKNLTVFIRCVRKHWRDNNNDDNRNDLLFEHKMALACSFAPLYTAISEHPFINAVIRQIRELASALPWKIAGLGRNQEAGAKSVTREMRRTRCAASLGVLKRRPLKQQWTDKETSP